MPPPVGVQDVVGSMGGLFSCVSAQPPLCSYSSAPHAPAMAAQASSLINWGFVNRALQGFPNSSVTQHLSPRQGRRTPDGSALIFANACLPLRAEGQDMAHHVSTVEAPPGVSAVFDPASGLATMTMVALDFLPCSTLSRRLRIVITQWPKASAPQEDST